MSLESTIRGVLTEQTAPKEITEAKDPEEYDQEGDMMKSQLRQIDSAIDKLMGMVKDDDNLPEWVQSKMTKATDYIRSVRDYLESEKMNEEWVCGKCNCDPCTCEELQEKAMSQAQQKAAGAALAAKRGDIKPSELVGASKEMYDSMSTKELEDFASTKHKGLPMKKEAYDEPQGQAKRMMSPLQKARMDKEKADRDRDGKLKPGVTKEEAELEEAKKVTSMQIHKVLAKTKNSREGIAALKKAFRVNDTEAKKMLNQVMNEETIDEISRSMTPMSKRFGKAVDPKKFDAYKKHVKQHGVDEPTVRFIDDNPNHNQSKRAMQDKHVAQAVKLYKAAHKESVDEVLDTPDRAMNYKHRAKYSRDRARNSQAAHMLRGTDPSKDKDTERKRERGLKTLDRNIAGKIRKSMMNSESAAADDAVRRHQAALQNARAAMKNAKSHDQMVKAMNAVRFHQKAVDRAMHSENTFISKFKEEIKEKKRMSETKGAPKGYHFTRSGQLKKGDAGQDGPGGKMLRSDPLDKQRKKIPPLPENDK